MCKEGKATKDIKLEPHRVAKQYERRWVRVENVEYDVTNFEHPGGSVILYMISNTGADATEAFKEFHMRSSKAQKVLMALPQREAEFKDRTTKEERMLCDFAKWRAQLEKEGFFKPCPYHLLYRVAELVAMFALGTFLMAIGTTSLSVLVYGALFGARCGWIQHEGGHNSLTGDIWWDKRIQAAAMGFGLGTSGEMWNQMHNKHHATPQKVRHDMDLDTTPAVAFFDTAVEENRPRGFSRMWLRFQAWTFVPITSGILVMAFWLFVLHPRQVVHKKNFEEGFWMVMSHTVRTLVIKMVTDYSWTTSYLLFCASMWVAGMFLFAHFSTSHTHTDIVPADKHISWVNYAVDHTVDIDPSRTWVSWLMGYLNCQVIHHLFPDMPQFRQPEVSKHFVKFAKKWDLNYKVMTYWGAWVATFNNLDTVGQHYYVHGKSKVV